MQWEICGLLEEVGGPVVDRQHLAARSESGGPLTLLDNHEVYTLG